MIGYIAVGVTCLFIGGLVGVLTLSLCMAAKERDELGKFSDDLCQGCFVNGRYLVPVQIWSKPV